MIRGGFRIFFLASVLFGLLSLTARASPSGAGKIAFSSDRDYPGRFLIYVMDVNGSNVTRLATIPPQGGDIQPAFSPDGHKIAFASGREAAVAGMQIFVMNADGSDVTWLRSPGAGGAPSFSPDGRRIVFSCNLGGFPHVDQQIWVMNSDGSNVTRLTNLQGVSDDPKFSPDGRKILFDFAPFDDDSDRQIYVMDADGSNITRLTNPPATNWSPSFSPDGRKIAFASVVSVTGVRSGIYVMNADGSRVTRLTSVPTVPLADESSPVYSPDGRKIAFSAVGQIYLMNADGSGLVRLTQPPGHSIEPAFGP